MHTKCAAASMYPWMEPTTAVPPTAAPGTSYPVPSTGWLCPRCGSGLAPTLMVCPCNSPTVQPGYPSHNPLPTWVYDPASTPSYGVQHLLDTDSFLADSKPYAQRHHEVSAEVSIPAPPFSALSPKRPVTTVCMACYEKGGFHMPGCPQETDAPYFGPSTGYGGTD